METEEGDPNLYNGTREILVPEDILMKCKCKLTPEQDDALFKEALDRSSADDEPDEEDDTDYDSYKEDYGYED